MYNTTFAKLKGIGHSKLKIFSLFTHPPFQILNNLSLFHMITNGDWRIQTSKRMEKDNRYIIKMFH